MSITIFLAMMITSFFSPLGAIEHIETVHSPDGKFTIDFYRYDPGATGEVGIRGELNVPLWFKKRIYHEPRMGYVEVEWVNNSIISINHQIIDLNKGETFGY
jgi:hypothetical protein